MKSLAHITIESKDAKQLTYVNKKEQSLFFFFLVFFL